MKVAQIQKFGGPEVIELVDIEKPKPGKGQVLVKVYAAAINPFDYKQVLYLRDLLPSKEMEKRENQCLFLGGY